MEFVLLTSLQVLAVLGRLALTEPDTAPIPEVLTRDPRLHAAARVLLATPIGRRVLGRYAAAGYTVLVAGPESRAANRYSDFAVAAGRPPAFRTDHAGRWVALMDTTLPPAAIAVGLTHEIMHVLGGAAPGTVEMGEEELRAWNVALDFYRELPEALRAEAAPRYEPYARWRNEHPADFARTMRCIYPDTPGCDGRPQSR